MKNILVMKTLKYQHFSENRSIKPPKPPYGGLKPGRQGSDSDVILVYPNKRAVANANLGVSCLKKNIEAGSDLCVELVTLDNILTNHNFPPKYNKLYKPPSRLYKNNIRKVKLIAFSISYELDYLNLKTFFDYFKLNSFNKNRSESDPLVIAGGVSLTLNPEPVANIFDAIFIGELEPSIGEFINIINKGLSKGDALKAINLLNGFYIPSIKRKGKVKKSVNINFKDDELLLKKLGQNEVFKNMTVLEYTRGCARRCNFCAAHSVYYPFRVKTSLSLKEVQDVKIGLVGPLVTGIKGLKNLYKEAQVNNQSLFLSSVHIDDINEKLLELISQSGQNSLTFSIEAGSQRLRNILAKKLTGEEILSKAQLISKSHIKNIKIYAMYGLPSEKEEDLQALINLVDLIRKDFIQAAKIKGLIGKISLSMNLFIPMPHTPMQWFEVASQKYAKKARKFIEKALKNKANLQLKFQSLKESYLQACILRSDRSFAEKVCCGEFDQNNFIKECLNLNKLSRLENDSTFPWDVVDIGISKEKLKLSYLNIINNHNL
ncbi:MAG: radical SAM protein [Pseudomonadota bacterium]